MKGKDIVGDPGWATKIKEKLWPVSLQTEIALMIAWDLDDAEFTTTLEEWLGSDGMMGRTIPIVHTGKEILAATKKIGYHRPFQVSVGPSINATHDQYFSYHDWNKHDRPAGYGEDPGFVSASKVHALWIKFFTDRNLPLPEVSKHYLERIK